MMNRPGSVAVAMILMGAVSCLLSYFKAPVELRLPIVLGFLLICPGFSVVRLLKLENELHVATLSLASSIAIASMVSLVAVYSGHWSPNGILVVIVAVTIAFSLVECINFTMALLYWELHPLSQRFKW